MPTYEYKCPKCGHAYESFQKMSDKTLAKCPNCGTRGRRVISGGGGIVFKGSGFYETDYKRAGKKSGDESSGSTTSTPAKPEKTEKPAEKPAEKITEKPKKKRSAD
jgi:putative FmdB family regulatory protein